MLPKITVCALAVACGTMVQICPPFTPLLPNSSFSFFLSFFLWWRGRYLLIFPRYPSSCYTTGLSSSFVSFPILFRKKSLSIKEDPIKVRNKQFCCFFHSGKDSMQYSIYEYMFKKYPKNFYFIVAKYISSVSFIFRIQQYSIA